MLSQKTYKIWRAINMVMLIAGLLMPWVDISFEPNPAIVYGWERFFWAIYYDGFGILSFSDYGLSVTTVLDFLIGLSAVFLVYYLFYNFFAIGNTHNKNKLFSIIILCLTPIILFDTLSGMWSTPFLEFWIFILGLLSCALVEWGVDYEEIDPDKLLPISIYKIWRIINACIIVTGVMLLWNRFYFHSSLTTLYTSLIWQSGFFENGFPFDFLFACLSLFFNILLLYYLTFDLIIAIEGKYIRDLRNVSLILFFTVPICLITWLVPNSPFGISSFLILVVGLLSSAILEWQPRQFSDLS